MNIEQFNKLTAEDAKTEITRCCGSSNWVKKVLENRPYNDKNSLLELAEKEWFNLSQDDWLEAFQHHPKIGDINSLSKKYANTQKWAEGEQSGVNSASENIIHNLAQGNKDYEEKFDYIFIVCATGKTAQEMLEILNTRLPNTAEEEIKIAIGEQNKITKIRLEKLLEI